MSLAGKLQIRDGQTLVVLHAPPGLALDRPESGTDPGKAATADAVLVFVSDSATLAERREPFLEAARRDALAWIAYPKGRPARNRPEPGLAGRRSRRLGHPAGAADLDRRHLVGAPLPAGVIGSPPHARAK